MDYFLGIDLGTSSAKALVVDERGKEIGSFSKDYDILIKQMGYAEQNPQTWWNAVKEILRKLTTEYKECENIKGIGFSGQMHGLVMVDKEGRPVRDAIIWLDQRSEKTIENIYKKIDKETLWSITYNRVSSGFAMPSLIWVKEHEKENFDKTYNIFLPKDYIRYKLTGVMATEASDASSTVMFDTKNRNWSGVITDKLGIPFEKLAKCFEANEIAGYITDSASKETGLRKGIPVVLGGADQPTQSVGNGAVQEGIICVSIGTSGQVSAFSQKPLHDKLFRTQTFCHVVEKGYSIFGAVLSSGLSLKWFRNALLTDTPYKELDNLAVKANAGSDGLVYLPYITGERTPHFDSLAKGIFFGMNLSHKKEHFVRAVMEGVVFSLRESFDIICEMGIGSDKIITAGGGSKSLLWKSMIADILGMPVTTVNVNEEACLGAAIISMIGVDKYKTYSEAVRECVRVSSEVIMPNKKNKNVYEERYALYKKIYEANKSLFRM